MNQSIEAVKARDRADESTTLYFSDLEMHRRATRRASPRPYGSYEEPDEAARHIMAADPVPPPPTADELARMAEERWATTSAPAYTYTATRTATGEWVYTARTATAFAT